MQASLVWGGVVNDDDVVVGVFLVEDALQVELESEVFGIVIGGHDYAERQLCLVLAEGVCLF